MLQSKQTLTRRMGVSQKTIGTYKARGFATLSH